MKAQFWCFYTLHTFFKETCINWSCQNLHSNILLWTLFLNNYFAFFLRTIKNYINLSLLYLYLSQKNERNWGRNGEETSNPKLFLLYFFKIFWWGLFLKSLLNLLQYYFCFMFWFLGHEACGILPPWPGIIPHPLLWKSLIKNLFTTWK